MVGENEKRTGRALTVTVVLILLIIGIFLARYFWPDPKIETLPIPVGESLQPSDLRFWTAEEVKNRLDAGEAIVFLDTRLRSEYETEHILDALHLPRESMQSFAPEAGKVYVIIVSQEDRDQTFWQALVDFLEEKSMNHAFLQNGMGGWRAIGGKIVSKGDPNSFLDQSKVTFVSPEQAVELLKSQAVTVLDIRSDQDFRAGHIPGARHLPLEYLEKRRSELTLGPPILVYGNNELTGFQAGVRLFDMSFFGPRVLEGGFVRWKEKNFPIEQ